MKPGAHGWYTPPVAASSTTHALCELPWTSGHLAGAALDVFEHEPLPEPTARLRSVPNLIMTPHLGASTKSRPSATCPWTWPGRSRSPAKQTGVVLNGINVAKLSPADARQVGPYMDLARQLASFLVQVHDGPLVSLRLTVQGGVPDSAHRALTVAMIVGALKPSTTGPLTPVNAERIADERNVRVHCEASTLKRDFMSLLRVEALIGDTRHFASGTVLGHNHPRLVELDDFVLDAIPEGPMLVTFHKDQPGVVGQLGTVLGQHDCNISRMQIGTASRAAAAAGNADGVALGVLNLDGDANDALLVDVRAIDAIERAFLVR